MIMRNDFNQTSLKSIKTAVCVLLILCLGVGSYFLLRSSKSDLYTGFEGMSHQEIFIKLDRDGDGQLSFNEFINVRNYFKITAVDNSHSQQSEKYPIQDLTDFPISPEDQLITLRASFVPLSLHSLTKDVKNIPNDQIGALQGLLEWKVPFKENQRFPSSSFSIFLPPPDKQSSPGSTWWIIKPILDETLNPMPSTRHFPPKVELEFHLLFTLLSMFHPQPFLWSRFAPQGTVAVLRAIGSKYFDIIFRMHAEFQLNKPPVLPLWFTPSQFQGRLIISRDQSTVLYFHLEVPNTKKLNVDMEWLIGPGEDNMEVDIGYLPQMSLSCLYEKSDIQVTDDDQMNFPDHHQDIDSLTWLEEISGDNALSVLESTMYSFKKVKYYNLTEAFHEANSKSKLIHGVLLWGALDDQSC